MTRFVVFVEERYNQLHKINRMINNNEEQNKNLCIK